jgi:hypothetical protein
MREEGSLMRAPSPSPTSPHQDVHARVPWFAEWGRAFLFVTHDWTKLKCLPEWKMNTSLFASSSGCWFGLLLGVVVMM